MKSISDLKVFYLVKKLLAKRTEDLNTLNKRIDEHTHKYAGSSSVGGSATSADKLSTARTLKANLNLSHEEADTFDGSSDARISVEGILPVENGGTGVDSLNELANNMGMTRSYVETYTGNGENTRTFIFDFEPEFVCISNVETQDNYRIFVKGVTKFTYKSSTGSTSSDFSITLEWGDDYITLAHDSGSREPGYTIRNEDGEQYIIFALGRSNYTYIPPLV